MIHLRRYFALYGICSRIFFLSVGVDRKIPSSSLFHSGYHARTISFHGARRGCSMRLIHSAYTALQWESQCMIPAPPFCSGLWAALRAMYGRARAEPYSCVMSLDVLNKTNMCDFAADVHKEVNGGEPTVEMKAKRAAAIEAHGTLSAAAAKAVKFASDVVAVNQLSRDKTFNVKFAKENHGIEAEDVEALFKFAKFQYECGDYVAAAAHLGVVQLLSTDAARCESALWGKYAADILTRNWQGALDDMNRLRLAEVEFNEKCEYKVEHRITVGVALNNLH